MTALKKFDPHLKDILETAVHVSLYSFNTENNEWEETGVEGALFIYSRTEEASHMLTIMNRRSTNNLVEPIPAILDLYLKECLLLYRNSSRIFAVWFHHAEECFRVAVLLYKLVKIHETNKTTFTTPVRGQEDHDSNERQENRWQVPEKEYERVVPQNSMDFFSNGSGDATQGGGLCRHQQRKASDELLANLGQDNSSQRHWSNPAHAMDYTRRQQQSETAGDSQRDENASSCNDGKTRNKVTPQPTGNMSVTTIHESSIKKQTSSMWASATLVESRMLQIVSSTRWPPLTAFFESRSGIVMQVCIEEGQPLSDIHCSAMDTHRIGMETSETPRAPLLMTPEMFISLISKDVPKSEMQSAVVPVNVSITSETNPEVCSTSGPSCAGNSHLQDNGFAPATQKPSTRSQLLQAFDYLIKNDPVFVYKLHEAYEKSNAETIM